MDDYYGFEPILSYIVGPYLNLNKQTKKSGMVAHAYHPNLEPQVGYTEQVKAKMLWVKGKKHKAAT